MSFKEPFVIVLILSYNGRELLKDSVSSYLRNNYQNFEVIVIDNGSTDGTKDYIKKDFPEAKVVRLEKNRGYSGGFNYGLKYATEQRNADYVLVTNNDVIADKNVIVELVKVAKKDSRIGFVTGKVYFNEHENTIIQTVGKFSHPINIVGKHIGTGEKDEGQYDNIEERDFVDDVFNLVNRKVIEKTGGYDETFFLDFEEADWQVRSKKLGYKIFYTPHAKLWHKVGMSTGGTTSPLRTFHLQRNQIIFTEKHLTPNRFLTYCFNLILHTLPKKILHKILTARYDLIAPLFRGILSGFKYIIKK